MTTVAVALGLTILGLCLWLRNTPYPPDDVDETSWGVKGFKQRADDFNGKVS